MTNKTDGLEVVGTVALSPHQGTQVGWMPSYKPAHNDQLVTLASAQAALAAQAKQKLMEDGRYVVEVGNGTMNAWPVNERQALAIALAGIGDGQAKPLTDCMGIKVKRELFSFHSMQDWVNKGQSKYANCGVRAGHYITVDALGHVVHMGLCFKHAAYPVTCYELQTNWTNETAHGIGGTL